MSIFRLDFFQDPIKSGATSNRSVNGPKRPRFCRHTRNGLPFLLVGLALFSNAPEAPASALIDHLKSGESQTIVTYGTSLTANYNTAGWVNDLRNWLNIDYPGLATVIDSGQSGKASNTGVAMLNTAVLSKHPDTVFIEFSMNDAFTQFGVGTNTDTVDASPQITLARAKTNLQSMISSIKTANPFAEVILMTMDVAYNSTSNPTAATYRPDLASYYQVYRDVAAEQNLLLIDNYVSWKSIYDSDLNTYKTYVPDGVHPTAAASTLITFNNVKTALTAVPEPSSSGLLAAAALAALILGRRSRAVWRKGFQCYRLPPR